MPLRYSRQGAGAAVVSRGPWCWLPQTGKALTSGHSDLTSESGALPKAKTPGEIVLQYGIELSEISRQCRRRLDTLVRNRRAALVALEVLPDAAAVEDDQAPRLQQAERTCRQQKRDVSERMKSELAMIRA